MHDDPIRLESHDATTAVLTLNRPEKRNAMSIALIESLTEKLDALAADRARRVAVIRGAGPMFCAGLDLKEAADPSVAHRSAESLARLYETICTSPLVVIVAAHNAALGGGAGLVAAADLVVASDDLQVGFPEVRRGIVAALVTALLRRQLGDRTVRDIILLGQTLDAPQCLAHGLVNRVVAPQALAHASLALAADVATGAPDALVRTKRLLNELAVRPIRDDLAVALRHHVNSRTSDEMVEGIAAFREKRAPRWGERTL